MDQCQILMRFFFLEFFAIDFKPWHNDPWVLKFYTMIFVKNLQFFFRIYLRGTLCQRQQD